jgi:capsular polysaccharide biosynthesis protein
MEVMIILNIILIIALTILVLYIFKNNRNSTENVCVNNKCSVESNEDNQNNNLNSERVFVGRFVTEDEYQQMMKNRKSDISILLDEVNSEYEHLKELNK